MFWLYLVALFQHTYPPSLSTPSSIICHGNLAFQLCLAGGGHFLHASGSILGVTQYHLQGPASQESTPKSNSFLFDVTFWSFDRHPKIQARAHSPDPSKCCLAWSCSPGGMGPFLP